MISSTNHEQPQQELARWYQTVAGQQLLRQENTMLIKGLEGIFGYHLLTLGPLDYKEAMSASAISHRLVINDVNIEDSIIHLLGSQYDLPLQKDSVDVVIMPHLLEYSPHPHQILREAERIIVPNGHMIILGFNPVSCYGFCRAVFGFMKRMPWKGHYYHPVRLRDWIQLLGFRITRISFAGFTPPLPYQAVLNKLAFLERASSSFIAPLGSIYMIVARNDAVTPTVIKTPWKRKRPALDKGMEPTTRMQK
jgi:SAM-dependent methyltransferase